MILALLHLPAQPFQICFFTFYYNCDGNGELGTDNYFVWQGQIKLKETALETSTNSFLEKEKDLKNKIEELESRVEEFSQNSSFCKLSFEKVVNFITYLMFQKHAYEHKTENLTVIAITVCSLGDIHQTELIISL